MSAPTSPVPARPLAAPIRKTCELLRLLAGHELLGLAPGQIAQALGVSPSWVSVNLPAIEAETGFVERVGDTGRWRLGVPLVRIAFAVSAELSSARRRLEEVEQRYGTQL